MTSPSQKKRFRTIAHKLKPVVTIAGNGVSESVNAELERALDDHELIKVKLASGERDERRQMLDAVVAATDAEVIQTIGSIAVIYRPASEPNPALSNVLRADVL